MRSSIVVFPILAFVLAAPAGAQSPQNNMWVTDGPVEAIATYGNNVFLGGAFTRVGPPTGAFLNFDAATGAIAPGTPYIVGHVNASIPDGSGGCIIAGSFSAVQGQTRKNLAQIDASGNVTSWNPGVDEEVYALAIDAFNPDVVYIGGLFTLIKGTTRWNAAAVSISTGSLLLWVPHLNGGPVYSIFARNGAIYLAGGFNQAEAITRNHLALYDAAGTLQSWDPNVNGIVYTMAGALAPFSHVLMLYIGGQFTSVAGQGRYSIAEVNGVSGAPTDWSPNSDHAVKAIALSFSRNTVNGVYAGGTFDQIGAQPRNHLALLDANTGAASPSFVPEADDEVDALSYDGVTLYAGGKFTHVGGAARSYLAELNPSSGAAAAWDPSPNGAVNWLDAGGGIVTAGGQFTSAGGVTRNHLAALDATTGMPTSWDPEPDASVYALATSGSTLYVGGGFTSVAGQTRRYAAAFDGTGALKSWNPDADNYVSALLPHGNRVYAGGYFSTIQGAAQSHIADLDAQTGAPGAPLPSPDGPISTFAMIGDTLYLGGRFYMLGATQRASAGAIALSSRSVTLWDPHPDYGTYDNAIHSIVVFGSSLLIGGDFSQLQIGYYNNLAQVDRVIGRPTGWRPAVPGPVNALQLVGSTLFVGGWFGPPGPGLSEGLIAFDMNSLALINWDSQMQGLIGCLAAGIGRLYAGGDIVGVGSWPHSGVAGYSGGVAAVGDPMPRRTPGAMRLSQNPSCGSVSFSFDAPASRDARVAVFDADGRLVRSIWTGALRPGEQQLSWDGRDESGKVVRSGIYFVRVRGEGLDLAAKITRLN